MSRPEPPGLDRVSVLTSSLQPHLSSGLASLSSHYSSLQSLGEERLPELVTARLYTARDQVGGRGLVSVTTYHLLQVTGGVHYLDSTLCHGLDQLLVKVSCYLYSTLPIYQSCRCPP